MAMWRIELGDKFQDYRATAAQSFLNDCFYATDGYKFFVGGNEATRSEAMIAAEEYVADKFNKKLETHKRIRVGDGVTHLQSKVIWVRK